MLHSKNVKKHRS